MCFNFGAAVAKIFNKCKKISPEKSFWKLRVLLFPPKPQFSELLRLLYFWREEQNSEFPKTFFGGYLFAVVEYLCNRSSKIKTKRMKNYSSILAILNHRNWLDDSPPLIQPSWDLRLLFAVKYLMINFIKCMLAGETCALAAHSLIGIRCEKIERHHAY